MPRLLMAIFLGLTVSNVAVAKNYCVRWECEVELTRESLLADDSTIWGDDSRRSLACGFNLPDGTQPRVTNLASRRKRVEPESPLQVFLRRWTNDARDIQEVRAGVHVIQYDNVFQLEERATGEIDVRPGYRGWIRTDGLKGELGRTRKIGDREYTCRELEPQEWYLTEALIYKVDRHQKVYLTIPSPWENKSQREKPEPPGILEAITRFQPDLKWVFLIPPSFEELQTKFWVSFENAKDGQVRLRLVPLPGKERQDFREIQILIDKTSLRTLAVRIQDPTGNRSTVYVFRNKRVVRLPKTAEPIPIPDLSEFKNFQESDFGRIKERPSD